MVERQRPRGDVVGLDDGAVDRGTDLGVALGTQHGQEERPVGLGRRNHHGAGGVGGIADLEGLGRLGDLDAVAQQQRDHLPGGDLVVLVGRDDEGVGRLVRSLVDGVAGHPVDVGQDVFAVLGDGLEIGPGRHQFVLDDVAQSPPSAGPGRGEVRPPAVLGEALAAAAQLTGIDIDRASRCGRWRPR